MDSNTLLQRFKTVRKQTEDICEPLEIEDYVAQPIVDVSPPKWHLGHTTWFFENFILSKLKDYQLFDEQFNFIFNSYYESQGERLQRDNRGTLARPSTEKIYSFRKHVDQYIENWLSKENEHDAELLSFLELGLNHEQQHQELLVTDIKYILGSNPLLPAYITSQKSESKTSRKANWIEIPEGIYEIGHKGNEFHFDNEEGRHKVFLHSCKVMDRLVTNAEYLEFMQDGGYEKYNYWLMEGWEWVKQNKAKAPFYWFQKKGEWYAFTHYGEQKVNMDATLTHINYYEADAFAAWKNKRLLTEFEWEVAAQKINEGNEKKGQFLLPKMNDNNFLPKVAAVGEDQFYGTAWEWTNSAYLPYPNYNKKEGALGEYNGKFMVNQMVLRGGSCATPIQHFRPTYRNFFHPHLQWQFTAIRLADKNV